MEAQKDKFIVIFLALGTSSKWLAGYDLYFNKKLWIQILPKCRRIPAAHDVLLCHNFTDDLGNNVLRTGSSLGEKNCLQSLLKLVLHGLG